MDNKILTVSVSEEFSTTPGPRYRSEGPFSGEQFREEVLLPKYSKALEGHSKLLVDLDGTVGYGTSFLEEVFGGLARERGIDPVIQTLQFNSKSEPYLVEDIIEYVKEANG